MNMYLKFLLAIVIPLASSCSGPHLISDKAYMQLVERSFTERKTLAEHRSQKLFSVFDQRLSLRQKEALKFLYAFMPLNDLADYDGSYFLSNINVSLRALDESPWGRQIPEDIFLHYVLPYRVNNENLDSFRIAYYDEIMSRIRNKNIIDAALEINHWCNEKVNYQPSDIRTSAPMSTILSACGRCGEESTFTVAALRTAGIPARQVYTPRWAHTDDNHAWVEIWSDGKWYYMGACEPEPVIDRGWFTEPARRAMLIHTKSFGPSRDGEKVVSRYRKFSEINCLSKYAVTKTIFVKVSDTNNTPVNNAMVEYQLYNYAEFYPLAVVPTDENGLSHFETGLGDLLVWASHNGRFNYRKISVSETDTLKLVLSKQPGGSYNVDLDLDVPLEIAALPGPSKEQIDANAKRISQGNAVRSRYIASWMKPEEAKSLAISRNVDTTRVMNIILRSMGNFREISSFLASTPDSLLGISLSLLELLPDKDLRDIKMTTLSDHLMNTLCPREMSDGEFGIFMEYVLNPRIANEMVAPWRSYLQDKLPFKSVKKAFSDPLDIAEYLEKNIIIADDENYYKTPITPVGVLDLKVSDSFSRDICFVAICRSLGIPARLEPGSNIPQYFHNSVWNDLYFSDRAKPSGNKGYIRLLSKDTRPVPEYYTQFTLAGFENGRYNTLGYDYNRKVTDFKDELTLAPGSYMLVTGNRLASGRILSSLSFFDLAAGEHRTVDVETRKESTARKILGKIDTRRIIAIFDKSRADSDSILRKGVVILWIEPDKEPSRHILSDLPRLRKDFDKWGGYLLFLTDPSLKWDGFSKEELKNMPANILWGTDKDSLSDIVIPSVSTDKRLPLVIMADKNGNILYASSGYRIGIGEEILRLTGE